MFSCLFGNISFFRNILFTTSIFYFFIYYNIYSVDDFNELSLFCELDEKNKDDNLYEAFYLSNSEFINYYFVKQQGKVVIMQTKAEKYQIDKDYLVIRGLKLNKKSLSYKTMGGNFLCNQMSKSQLLTKLEKIKKIKEKKN